MSLFDLLHAIGFVGGIVVGAEIGSRFGWIGGILGAVIGTVAGFIIGRTPYVVVKWILQRGVRKSSNEKLYAQLVEQGYISYMHIEELLARGESIETIHRILEAQGMSGSVDVWRLGEINARLWRQYLEEPCSKIGAADSNNLQQNQ